VREIELKVLCELMKNSKQSDRKLAKIIRVTQSKITRARRKLEKEGYIKEYTLIPDFTKLGFELMALTFVRYKKGLASDDLDKIRKAARKMEQENPIPILMAVSGGGLGYERVAITFHKDYSSFVNMIRLLRMFPLGAIDKTESFLVATAEAKQYQPCTFSKMANYLLMQEEEKKKE